MNNYRDILISLAWRAAVAAPFFYIGLSGRTVAFSPFFVVAGAIILAAPLARLFAEPSGNLFWPADHFDGPQPMYSIPQSKRAAGLYEEAMAGYEKIAAQYPAEVKPYIEMMDISIMDLKAPERADEIYQRGISRLPTNEDKEALVSMYSAIRSRMNTRHSN